MRCVYNCTLIVHVHDIVIGRRRLDIVVVVFWGLLFSLFDLVVPSVFLVCVLYDILAFEFQLRQ